MAALERGFGNQTIAILQDAKYENLGGGYFLKGHSFLVRVSAMGEIEILTYLEGFHKGREAASIDLIQPGNKILPNRFLLKLIYKDGSSEIKSIDGSGRSSPEGNETVPPSVSLPQQLVQIGFKEGVPNSGIFSCLIEGEEIFVICLNGRIEFIGKRGNAAQGNINIISAGRVEREMFGHIEEVETIRFQEDGYKNYVVDENGFCRLEGVDLSVDLFNLDLPLTAEQDYREPPNKEGFGVGGVNANGVIDKMEELTGLSIDEIEARARPHADSVSGFIGNHETFKGVLKEDNEYVRSRDRTHQELAALLFDIINIIHHLDGNNFKFRYRGRVLETISGGTSNGDQSSIFNDGLMDNQNYRIRDVETGEELTFTRLAAIYIWRYGFYEGRGDTDKRHPDGSNLFRVEPARVMRVLNLKAGDSPVAKAFKSSPMPATTLEKVTAFEATMLQLEASILRPRAAGESNFQPVFSTQNLAKGGISETVIRQEEIRLINEGWAVVWSLKTVDRILTILDKGDPPTGGECNYLLHLLFPKKGLLPFLSKSPIPERAREALQNNLSQSARRKDLAAAIRSQKKALEDVNHNPGTYRNYFKENHRVKARRAIIGDKESQTPALAERIFVTCFSAEGNFASAQVLGHSSSEGNIVMHVNGINGLGTEGLGLVMLHEHLDAIRGAHQEDILDNVFNVRIRYPWQDIIAHGRPGGEGAASLIKQRRKQAVDEVIAVITANIAPLNRSASAIINEIITEAAGTGKFATIRFPDMIWREYTSIFKPVCDVLSRHGIPEGELLRAELSKANPSPVNISNILAGIFLESGKLFVFIPSERQLGSCAVLNIPKIVIYGVREHVPMRDIDIRGTNTSIYVAYSTDVILPPLIEEEAVDMNTFLGIQVHGLQLVRVNEKACERGIRLYYEARKSVYIHNRLPDNKLTADEDFNNVCRDLFKRQWPDAEFKKYIDMDDADRQNGVAGMEAFVHEHYSRYVFDGLRHEACHGVIGPITLYGGSEILTNLYDFAECETHWVKMILFAYDISRMPTPEYREMYEYITSHTLPLVAQEAGFRPGMSRKELVRIMAQFPEDVLIRRCRADFDELRRMFAQGARISDIQKKVISAAEASVLRPLAAGEKKSPRQDLLAQLNKSGRHQLAMEQVGDLIDRVFANIPRMYLEARDITTIQVILTADRYSALSEPQIGILIDFYTSGNIEPPRVVDMPPHGHIETEPSSEEAAVQKLTDRLKEGRLITLDELRLLMDFHFRKYDIEGKVSKQRADIARKTVEIIAGRLPVLWESMRTEIARMLVTDPRSVLSISTNVWRGYMDTFRAVYSQQGVQGVPEFDRLKDEMGKTPPSMISINNDLITIFLEVRLFMLFSAYKTIYEERTVTRIPEIAIFEVREIKEDRVRVIENDIPLSVLFLGGPMLPSLRARGTTALTAEGIMVNGRPTILIYEDALEAEIRKQYGIRLKIYRNEPLPPGEFTGDPMTDAALKEMYRRQWSDAAFSRYALDEQNGEDNFVYDNKSDFTRYRIMHEAAHRSLDPGVDLLYHETFTYLFDIAEGPMPWLRLVDIVKTTARYSGQFMEEHLMASSFLLNDALPMIAKTAFPGARLENRGAIIAAIAQLPIDTLKEQCMAGCVAFKKSFSGQSRQSTPSRGQIEEAQRHI